MAKRIFWGVAAVCFLIILFVVFMSDTSQKIFGVRLAHNLQIGRAENIVVIAQLLGGSEIRPVSSDGNVLPSANVNTENYDVRLSLKENIQSQGSEDVVLYSVDGVESEQIGTHGASDMIRNAYRLRLHSAGLPIELKRTEGQPSRVWDDLRLLQIMAAWWPAMPAQRLRQGDSWNASWDAPFVVEVLNGKKISLRHEVKYSLDAVKADKGLNIAHVTYKGTVEPSGWDALPEGVEIAGTGTIAGDLYINVATGQTVVCDERLIWSVVVRLRKDDMEVVQFADRNSRTYRPRLLPHGDAGFSKQKAGGSSAEGLPTAGEFMNKAKTAAPAATPAPAPSATAPAPAQGEK
ncbi:MAG: hypothetical protein Q4F00_08705 [bacterium]|nr:hypothetical protein [bacterium]